MSYNNGCCPTTPPKNNDCSCKDGMLCALDWFFQDFLLRQTDNNSINALFYYPKLNDLMPIPPNTQNIQIPNLIFYIPYLTSDIVPVYINEYTKGEPYTGNITYLNICKLNGFFFTFKDSANKSQKENDIITRFSKLAYCKNNTCCKNGVIESLLRARDFLLQDETGEYIVLLSNSTNSFRINNIIAINSDTVWAKYTFVSDQPITYYYVLSICDLSGITLVKTPIPEPVDPPEEESI